MSDLIDTTEMYLRTILELEEDDILPLRARIAEILGHSGPTVSQTIARMQRDGLVRVLGDRQLDLTVMGRGKAVAVMRKHRLAECLLADVVGLGWEYVHEEACRWEHVMSSRVEERLYELLRGPEVSPYGNVIPGLEDIGGSVSSQLLDSSVSSLVSVADSCELEGVLVRFGEPVQVYVDLLSDLYRGGFMPGKRIVFSKPTDGFVVLYDVAERDNSLLIPVSVASHIFIRVL